MLNCSYKTKFPMKTNLRLMALGTGILGLLFCVGCDQQKANAEVPNYVRVNPPLVLAAVPNAPAPIQIQPAENAVAPAMTNVPAAAPAVKEAPATPSTPAVAVVSAPTVPDSLNISPALGEVVKLVKAGVSEDVLMAYVTNSTELFELGSNEIVYLHDLGVTSGVITALIQRNASPETQARKQAAVAVQPLPPGVGLNTPATNVYPPKAAPVPIEPVNTSDTVAANTPPTVIVQPPVVVGQPVVVEQPVSYSYFYTSLSPYGSWVDVPGYGSCWRPTVAVCNSAWRPYADNGRWLWSDAGWYWYSDYSWGWAPFHYGRWACPAGLGWVWQPDTHWGPSWVSWRNNGSYCGWAPLPPSAVWHHGHGFYHNTASVGIGFDFGIASFSYTWISTSRLCDRNPYHHYSSHAHGQTLHKDSTVINNYVSGNNNTIINNGVGRDHVAKVSRGDIRQVALRDGSAVRDLGSRRENLAADGRTLTVARPSFAVSKIGAPSSPVTALSGVRGRDSQPASSSSGSSGVSTKPARFTSITPSTSRSPIAVNGEPGANARLNVPQASVAATPKEGGASIAAKPVVSPRGSSSGSHVAGSIARPKDASVPRSTGGGGRDAVIVKPGVPSAQIGSGNVNPLPSRIERNPRFSAPAKSQSAPTFISRPTVSSTPSPIARTEPAPRYSAPVVAPSVRSASPAAVPVQPRYNAPSVSVPSPSARGGYSQPSSPAPSSRGVTVAPSRGDGGSKAAVGSGNSGNSGTRSSGGGFREGR